MSSLTPSILVLGVFLNMLLRAKKITVSMSRRTLCSVKLCRLARSAILIRVFMRSFASSMHWKSLFGRLFFCRISRRILASVFSTQWSPDRELVLSSFLRRPHSLPGMRTSRMSLRRYGFLCLAENYIEERTCRNILDGFRRAFCQINDQTFLTARGSHAPHKWL